MAKVITISKKLAEEDELEKTIPLVKLSKFEKKAIRQSRKEIKNGESISLNRLKNELGC